LLCVYRGEAGWSTNICSVKAVCCVFQLAHTQRCSGVSRLSYPTSHKWCQLLTKAECFCSACGVLCLLISWGVISTQSADTKLRKRRRNILPSPLINEQYNHKRANTICYDTLCWIPFTLQIASRRETFEHRADLTHARPSVASALHDEQQLFAVVYYNCTV